MSQESKSPEPKPPEPRQERETRVFTFVAGAMMVAAITFGLLNTFHVIHM